MEKHIQAKAIDDARVLAIVAELVAATGLPATRWHVAERLPAFPEKVVRAKLASLLRRGLLTGCPCDCRGDFEVVTKA